MKVTYCWMEPSGYLTACVSELSRRPDVEVSLMTWETAAVAPFAGLENRGVRSRVLTRAERDDPAVVARAVCETNPDVVVISGWAHRPYVRLLDEPSLRHAKFAMTADTPLRFDWRQRLARLKIGRLLRRVDAIVVPGERGYQLMRYWGVPAAKVTQRLYCIDYRGFAGAAESRFAASRDWPRRFLFVGRYLPIKAVDVLVEAYARYRDQVAEPWPLVTCGTGPLQNLLTAPGIEDRGFVQPADLPGVFLEAGAFLLPSRSDAWGQAIVEAAAAGLPVVCSQGCGAAETVKDFHNGFVVPVGDAAALARAMRWLHEHHGLLPHMGRRAQEVAAAFSAECWADVQVDLCERLLGRG
jgi:glycosyltransferase involved in cell wall biosynthesis